MWEYCPAVCRTLGAVEVGEAGEGMAEAVELTTVEDVAEAVELTAIEGAVEAVGVMAAGDVAEEFELTVVSVELENKTLPIRAGGGAAGCWYW